MNNHHLSPLSPNQKELAVFFSQVGVTGVESVVVVDESTCSVVESPLEASVASALESSVVVVASADESVVVESVVVESAELSVVVSVVVESVGVVSVVVVSAEESVVVASEEVVSAAVASVVVASVVVASVVVASSWRFITGPFKYLYISDERSPKSFVDKSFATTTSLIIDTKDVN